MQRPLAIFELSSVPLFYEECQTISEIPQNVKEIKRVYLGNLIYLSEEPSKVFQDSLKKYNITVHDQTLKIFLYRPYNLQPALYTMPNLWGCSPSIEDTVPQGKSC